MLQTPGAPARKAREQSLLLSFLELPGFFFLFFKSTISINWTFIAWMEDSEPHAFPRIPEGFFMERRAH